MSGKRLLTRRDSRSAVQSQPHGGQRAGELQHGLLGGLAVAAERHPPPSTLHPRQGGVSGLQAYQVEEITAVADCPSHLESGLCSLPSGLTITRPQAECSARHSGRDQKPRL